MVQRRVPLTIYRPPSAGVIQFATLAAFEAAARAVIISVFPVLLFRNLGSAAAVSEAYLAAGIVSLVVALFTPWLAGKIPRRWLYTLGVCAMIASNLAMVLFGEDAAVAALIGNTLALVVMTVCFNAYVMDYIERTSMGRNETMRLLFSGTAWMVGPFLGVWLMDIWPDGPFVLASGFSAALLALFWYLRLGNGKVIARVRTRAVNPLAYLPRFFRQPLLVAGWAYSCVRSVGWQVFTIYLPIYCIQNGLGEQLGGLMFSISNGLLFLAPLMLRYLVGRSVRFAIRVGFGGCAFFYLAAAGLAWFGDASMAYTVVFLLLTATLFLVLLDVAAGLPFLMSVKPSERTDMAAVYSTFRDVSAVVTPGVGRAILAIGPLPAVFTACGLGLFACWVTAGKLNPALGRKRRAAIA